MVHKGSEWRKWNFHVHTKGTNKNDQFKSSTMDDFFAIFFKKAIENQVSAIGITDYFSIDRYKDSVAYQENIEHKYSPDGTKLFSDEEIEFIKGIFLFPNVELRMLPSTDKGKLINIHCLFNPEYVPDLENDFFSNIENQDGSKMNRHGLIQYGKSLDSSIKPEHKQYEKGVNNFVVDLKSLIKLRDTNKRFRDNTLLVVSNSNNDGASAIQKHFDLFEGDAGSLDGLRNSIYKFSDAIFSSNPRDIKYFSGRKSEGKEGYDEELYKKEVAEVIENRGSLKPCIVGCDAHTEDKLFSRFTWVKADLNFEGLRQICYEPEIRVKIQPEKPDFKEEKLLIESVRFISPNSIFTSNPIYLNPNLNVIIGGKSSGKSILLYSIAKTLSADDKILRKEDKEYKYDLEKIDSNFDFEITTQGGFKQRINRIEEENSILPEIKYIPQNYLVKLAEPELNKKGDSLNKLVRDLIKEDSLSNEIYKDFLNKVKQNDRLRNSQIDLFFQNRKEIELLEQERRSLSNKSVLEQNIKSNEQKVEELNKSTGLTPEQVEQYKTLQNKLEKNNERLQMVKEDLSATQNFNTEFVQTLKNLKQKKDTLLSELQVPELRMYYENAYSLIDELNNQSIRLERELSVVSGEGGKRFFPEGSKFKEVLSLIRNERKGLDKEISPFLKDEEVKKAIQILNQSIANDKKALLDIENLTRKIVDKRKLLKESKEEIFEIYKNSFEEYGKVISSLKERTVELEKDGLGIIGKAQYNFPKLRKELWEVSDGRTASYNRYEILGKDKKATDDSNFDFILGQIKSLFDDILSDVYALTKNTTVESAIKLILQDHFFDYWEISYRNDILGKMSTGKASFVILMLIIGLSKSKAPILIDQPEDNLDNRSITTDLVDYLRKKKVERQIIVVTHNANIVVNADAENVIVANQKGQNDEESSSPYKFDYINGAIENSFEKLTNESDLLKSMGIRQHIAEIVEGGKDAFIMREKKYRFH